MALEQGFGIDVPIQVGVVAFAFIIGVIAGTRLSRKAVIRLWVWVLFSSLAAFAAIGILLAGKSVFLFGDCAGRENPLAAACWAHKQSVLAVTRRGLHFILLAYVAGLSVPALGAAFVAASRSAKDS